MLIAVEIYCPDTERCVLMVLWIVWWFCILLWDWHRGLVINFQRICHAAPRCLTSSSYTLPANYTQRQQNLLTPTASFKAEESHCLCYIVKPHHTHWVQRCGLLLPMFRVPCLYLLLDITVSCGKTDEPIELPFGIWTRAGPRNHVLGGGPDPQFLQFFEVERPCDAAFRQHSLTTCMNATAYAFLSWQRPVVLLINEYEFVDPVCLLHIPTNNFPIASLD